MKKVFVLVCLLAGFYTHSSALQPSLAPVTENVVESHRGIRFASADWAQVVEKAKAEHKLIFVDFYTQWCGPCYNMATTVFTLPDVAAFYNKNFVCAKIDAEVGEGLALAKKYAVRSYPTYAFIDPETGELVHRSGGRQTPEMFIYTGQSALDPTMRSTYLLDAYAKGNRERTLLLRYIRYKHSIFDRKSVNDAFAELIKGGASLKEREIWDIFVETVNSLSPYLLEVSDHYKEYCQLYGKAAVDAKFSKETQFGDLKTIESLCDFKDKAFNCEMIRISNALYREHNYDDAIRRIDALIANPQTDQQQLIDRLRFIARVKNYTRGDVPQKWIDKCIEYARYVAYNNADRDDAVVHQTYAEALEWVLQRTKENKQIPAGLLDAPKYGRSEYSMRPDGLKQKPQYRKNVTK